MAKEKKEEIVDSVKLTAQTFFKNNKEIIYDKHTEPFKISTGVLSLDSLLEGGIPSGILCRLLGVPCSGKSSEGLLIIKNFLETRPRARALIIPTEARLTEKLKSRSGVKFVDSPDQWENKTCLVLPTNIYDKIANFIYSLVKTNEMHKPENQENFIIMIDSMDYLMLETDYDKEIGVARKVAGPQYLTKMLWSKLALPFSAGQHLCIAISQQSAAPKIDPYSKDPLRQGGSSGGTNIQYQSSLVIDFNQRFEGDYILSDMKAKYDPKKNDKIGHIVKGVIRKSDVEKYDAKFEYSVKYGKTDGNSIWLSREIAELLLSWNFLERNGGWYNFDTNFLKELHDNKFTEVNAQYQGLDSIYELLDQNNELTKHLFEKFKNLLTHQ